MWFDAFFFFFFFLDKVGGEAAPPAVAAAAAAAAVTAPSGGRWVCAFCTVENDASVVDRCSVCNEHKTEKVTTPAYTCSAWYVRVRTHVRNERESVCLQFSFAIASHCIKETFSPPHKPNMFWVPWTNGPLALFAPAHTKTMLVCTHGSPKPCLASLGVQPLISPTRLPFLPPCRCRCMRALPRARARAAQARCLLLLVLRWRRRRRWRRSTQSVR